MPSQEHFVATCQRCFARLSKEKDIDFFVPAVSAEKQHAPKSKMHTVYGFHHMVIYIYKYIPKTHNR